MKLVLLIFLVILGTNLQIGIGAPFLNLVLLLVLGAVVFDRIKYAFVAALAGGILLDIYSIFPPGIFIASLLMSLAISIKFKEKFSLEAAGNVFMLGVTGAVIYEISVLALVACAWLLKVSRFKIIFNQFWLSGSFWGILSSAIGLTLIFLIIRKYRTKIYGKSFYYKGRI